MSSVYKGVHKTLDYPVAIKILDPTLADDQTFIDRFELEAKAASALRSNRIVSVIDWGRDEDTDSYFIVMEYVDGRDLSEILKDVEKSTSEGGPRGLPAEITLILLEEIAHGLKAAHDNGIIHRDIKPNNVMISRQGEVKIGDFGLARDTGDLARLSSRDLTRPGTVLGTPAYMSPEQAAGKDKRQIDHRSDIFSLGVVAYELLAGEKPFKGDHPTMIQERILNEDPPPLTADKCPLVNPEIEAFVLKMLKKDPSKRYQSMDQILGALRGCIEGLDHSGSLFKYRGDYLTRFAEDPVGFSKEMRTISIKSHLKLGYHFKEMGLSNIDDALQHFNYVLAMDPDNQKAAHAITELQKEQQSQQTRIATPEGVGAPAGDVTRIVADSPDQTRVVGEPPVETDVTKVIPGGEAAPEVPEAPPAPKEPPPPKKVVKEKPPAEPPPPPPKKPEAPPPPEKPKVEEVEERKPAAPRRTLALAGGIVLTLAILIAAYFVIKGFIGKPVEQPGGTPIQVSVLRVNSSPEEAEIWIRRPGGAGFEDTRLSTNTDLVGIEPGALEVQLRKENYETTSQLVQIVAGDTLELAFPLTLIEALGRLSISTVPQTGAWVEARRAGSRGAFDLLLGRTPVIEHQIVAGEWEVRAELDDYYPETLTVAVVQDSVTDGLLRLRRIPPTVTTGLIIVRSEPSGATVSIRRGGDSQFRTVGTTPYFSEEMPAGMWEVKVEKEGYPEKSATIDLPKGETEDLTFSLAPPGDGFVNVVVAPYADIYLNGERVASEQRRAVLKVPSGKTHNIELRHPPSFGRMVLDGVRVSANDTLDLGRKVFNYGSLTVSSNMAVHVVVDGTTLDGQTPLRLEKVGTGDHLISVYREGLFVRQAQLVNSNGDVIRTLSPMNTSDPRPRYRVKVVNGEQTVVRFEMNRKG
jgi:serine/threonine protein kinase